MAIRFSKKGPYFPRPLIDSLIDREVVFLCGAGISSPQMPDFRNLVKCVYKQLKIDPKPEEQTACQNGHFEEALESIRGRLTGSDELTHAVSDLLKVRENPYIKNHRTLLRLSRDHNNRICIVTTNFDTLLERAMAEIIGDKLVKKSSFAGQELPMPGDSFFSGIIHIHGRLADEKLRLEASQLVLTSADYGDAYMRSGWILRFLFDLARCKTIVLVGYSANDAPIRYFLNMLKVDRARFSDVKPVYAFHACKCEPEEYERDAKESWNSVAVTPLPYGGIDPDHMELWKSLEELADLVERPKQFRQERASMILQLTAEEAKAKADSELTWLFNKCDDLRSVMLDTISDPEWFVYFHDKNFWSTSSLAELIAAWIAKDWQDAVRFECALEWQFRFGDTFTEMVRRFLHIEGSLEKIWIHVWRFFFLVEPFIHGNMAYHNLQQRLTSGVVFDSDLQEAVNLLAPKPAFRKEKCRLLDEMSDSESSEPHFLAQLISMERSDQYDVEDLINTLQHMHEHSLRILELATAELKSVLKLQAVFDPPTQEHDPNSLAVPSIENHDQNQYGWGIIFLVRAMVNCIPQAIEQDCEYTKKIATSWKHLPGRIGLRLYLHAMREDKLFDANEAMLALLSISEADFWSIHRELPLVLRDRARGSSPEILKKVEDRIRRNDDNYYSRFPTEQGQVDWHAPVRDFSVWIRLKMLKESNLLTEDGIAELSAIIKRYQYLNREIREEDFFAFYSCEPRLVEGNPDPISEAHEDDRLLIAYEQVGDPDPDIQEGWSAFCEIDPQKAFNSLIKGGSVEKNLLLWEKFLNKLTSTDKQGGDIHIEVSIRAMEHLFKEKTKTLQPMIWNLCNLLLSRPRERVKNFDDWLLKLWNSISPLPDDPIRPGSGLYERAINSPAGKISQILIREISERKQKGLGMTSIQRHLIESISVEMKDAGHLGCAIFTHHVAFLLTVNREIVVKGLVPRISSQDDIGMELRAQMLLEKITPEVTNILKKEIINGVIESEASGPRAMIIAGNILRPALALLRKDPSVVWNMTIDDMRYIIRKAKPAIRAGVLNVMRKKLQSDTAGAESTWDQMVLPFFKEIWPKEKKFVTGALTQQMVNLVIGSGQRFPEALEAVRPYIHPYDQGYKSLRGIADSEVLRQFPLEMLDLIWLVCGPKSRGEIYELSTVIDKLVEADPNIEANSRLQKLKRRTERYG